MKKVVPFKKEIIFKTNVSEITSISLEHSLHVQDHTITGDFMVSGDYKMADTSVNTENFYFEIPFQISMDSKYLLDHIQVDVQDFYYELINNNILSVYIEVCVDKLEEKLIESDMVVPIPVEVEEKIEAVVKEDESMEDVRSEEVVAQGSSVVVSSDEVLASEAIPVSIGIESGKIDNVKVEENTRVIDTSKEVKSLFDSFDDSNETYSSYKVYIVREEDTVESIMMKYSIQREDLECYNDLKEIKIGDKLIIPASKYAKD